MDMYGMELFSDFWLWVKYFAVPVAIWAVYEIVRKLSVIATLPPGPWGLPLVGYAPFLSKSPHLTLAKLAKRYGDIMSFSLCGRLVIHLNSSKVVREVLAHEASAGRPKNCVFDWIADGLGIIQIEGDPWTKQRRFFKKTLGDLVLGTGPVEHHIVQQALKTKETLKKSEGQPIHFTDMMSSSSLNVICSMLFNKLYDEHDDEFKDIQTCVRKLFSAVPVETLFFPTLQMRIWGVKSVTESIGLDHFDRLLMDISGKMIRHHQETMDRKNIRDCLDAYLNEEAEMRLRGDPEAATFTAKRLQAVCVNMFMAGTVTVSSALNWTVWHLVTMPDVQQKIQQDIDKVIGRDRPPSWSDRERMPYLEAVILEVLRYTPIDPFIPPRRIRRDMTVRGYHIPKGSIVISNAWNIHSNTENWENPKDFAPERFLDSKGKLQKSAAFLAFGTGQRSCLGEPLARMSIFLIIASILQHFSLSLAEESRRADMRSGATELINWLPKTKIRALPREHYTAPGVNILC